MPREVVPIFRSPRRASLSRSSSRWYGRIRCALSLMMSRSPIAIPAAFDLVDLGEQRLRIDDHAVADHAGDARVQNARGQQPQHELAAVGVHRVAGVVAALVARDDRKVRREQIDDLALSLVPPLRAEHRDVHNCSILPFSMVLLDGHSLTLDDLVAIADEGMAVGLAPAAAAPSTRPAPSSIAKPRATRPVYGINTGFGSLAETPIPRDALGALQLNLLRSHAAGVGEPLPGARGARDDGAARERARQGILRHPPRHARTPDRAAQPRVHPLVPSRGSVGASGDLAPLAHLALVLIGEGQATRRGRCRPARTRGAARRRTRAGLARAEGRARAHQRHAAVDRGRGAGRRRRRAARARRRHRRGAVDRRPARLAPSLRRAHPRRAAARRPVGLGRQHPRAAVRQRHQPVARELRPRAGCLFAALRGAGARRGARCAAVRARDA